MVGLFGRDQSVVSRHIRNTIAEGEVSDKSNMQKMHIANPDRPTILYDLDVVISVGYKRFCWKLCHGFVTTSITSIQILCLM